jgi:hypothetical protein
MKTFVADAEARLNAGLDVRFGDRARQLRAAEGKDSGRVRLGDGPFVVVADLTKRIDWDQEKLAAIIDRIRQSGDDPAEYIRTSYEVRERAYGAWPQVSAGCSSRPAPFGWPSRGTRSRRAGKRRQRDGRPQPRNRRYRRQLRSRAGIYLRLPDHHR